MYRENMYLLTKDGDNSVEANRHEHWKLETRAYKRAYEKMIYDAFLRDMEADPKKYFKKDNFSNIENYNTVKALIKERGRTWDYIRLYITLNKERDRIEYLSMFIDKIHKMCKWKWIESATFNIEWRNHANLEGMHSHVLIKLIKGKRYSQAKKQIINTWKVNGYVKMYPSNDKNDDYIKGKKCKSKMLKVSSDMILRDKCGIKDYYTVRKESP